MRGKAEAFVSNIQHFCVHDGNGFRTTVFLQGCSLHCQWCQNPELQAAWPGHMYNQVACTGCLACQQACPQGNLVQNRNGFRPINAYLCRECSIGTVPPCVKSCAFEARSVSSRCMTAAETYAECCKEQAFWGDSGGITLSGGEPLLHIDFCREIGELCRLHGVNLAIETCGYVKWESFEQMIGLAGCFLYDVKLITPALRKKWLGAEDSFDLDNLRRLAGQGSKIVVRVPLVPGVNDTSEEFGAIIELAGEVAREGTLHILPFHQLGGSKYLLAGLEYSMADWQENNVDGIERCRRLAEEAGFIVDIGGKAFTV